MCGEMARVVSKAEVTGRHLDDTSATPPQRTCGAPRIPTPLLSDLNSPMRLRLRLGLYRLPRRRRPPCLRRILRSWAVLRGTSWLSAVRTGIMWMDAIIIGS